MSRFYPAVTEPLRGPGAFAEISEVASQPQAAILLLLARQLRGDAASRQAPSGVAESPTPEEWDLPEGETFPIPRVGPSHGAFSAQDVEARARKAYGAVSPRRFDAMTKAYASCAERLYQQPGADTAADLMEMCLKHPRELVRIAAAYAYLPLTTAPSRCVRHLVRGLKSNDELEADLAATALAQIHPEHAALRRLSRKRPRGAGPPRPPHTLTLAHGTWASGAEWYQPPAGSFFTFVETLRPDLYGGADFFSWSGGYSDGARAQGAVDLKAWVDDHNEDGLDIMGHSHGANVILRATQLGMTAGKVVLLSCPVHAGKYFPDLARVRQPVHSVRVKLDLVILADRGGQRFHHPAIQEHVLPIWFDHSASHDPAVWQAHGVAQKVGL
jgi:hypothetical protein